MKLKIYSIRDAKIEAFNQPFTARTHGEARRMFMNTAAGDNNIFRNHADYQLYYIGDLDDANGELHPMVPEMIMTGTEAMQGVTADL